MRVDRELAVERDATASVEPVVGLAEVTESEALEPRDGIEGEAVVHQRQVHLGRSHVGPRPQVRGLADDLWPWVRVSWSHETRSRICVPTASMRTAGCGRSSATAAAETMTAMDPSHGTS